METNRIVFHGFSRRQDEPSRKQTSDALNLQLGLISMHVTYLMKTKESRCLDLTQVCFLHGLISRPEMSPNFCVSCIIVVVCV